MRVEKMGIRSDPAPTVVADPEHPYPFLYDPLHRLYAVWMVFVYELAEDCLMFQTFDFLIPASTIWNVIPEEYGGFFTHTIGKHDLKLEWRSWGANGARILDDDVLQESYTCYIYGMRFITVPDNSEVAGENEMGRRVTVYDFSPYAVKRAQMNPSPPGVIVSILGEQTLTPNQDNAFGQVLRLNLPCVRRRTVESHVFDSAMMDAESIILVKPTTADRPFDQDMEIWTM